MQHLSFHKENKPYAEFFVCKHAREESLQITMWICYRSKTKNIPGSDKMFSKVVLLVLSR